MKSNIEELCVQTHKPPGRIDLIFMIIERLTGLVEGREGSEAPAVLALNVYISVSVGGSQSLI